MSSSLPPRAVLSHRTGVALALIVIGALVAAGAWALVGGGGDGNKGGGDSQTAGRPTVPALGAGALFGVHTEVGDDSVEAEKKAIEKLETHLGRNLDINHTFYPWEKEFPTELEEWDLASGRIPMISWNGRGPFADDIAAGQHDPLIQDRALRVKELKGRVLIRWFWEMDGNNKAEWAKSPTDYIGAWRRIVDLFREQGADNVEWVWCPNASAFRDGEAQAFYPGPEYVDWICGDGYNWAPGRAGDDWRAFREVFEGFYAWASKQNKRIMVGEFGVQERSPGEKAAWITDVKDTLKAEFPLINAVVYFDANKDYDWRMNTSPGSYDAFKALANDPWFAVGLNRLLPK